MWHQTPVVIKRRAKGTHGLIGWAEQLVLEWYLRQMVWVMGWFNGILMDMRMGGS